MTGGKKYFIANVHSELLTQAIHKSHFIPDIRSTFIESLQPHWNLFTNLY